MSLRADVRARPSTSLQAEARLRAERRKIPRKATHAQCPIGLLAGAAGLHNSGRPRRGQCRGQRRSASGVYAGRAPAVLAVHSGRRKSQSLHVAKKVAAQRSVPQRHARQLPASQADGISSPPSPSSPHRTPPHRTPPHRPSPRRASPHRASAPRASPRRASARQSAPVSVLPVAELSAARSA